MTSLLLRVASAADASAIREIYAPSIELSHTSFEVEVPSIDEMARRITETLRAHPWLVAERDGVVVGYAYASVHRTRAAYQWSCEVSVYVRSGAHRGGIGRTLYRTLFALLRDQGFHNAFAGITLPNPPSIALHESLGFVPIGVYKNIGFKQGAWHDVGWWQLALGDGRAPDGPPRPFDPARLGSVTP